VWRWSAPGQAAVYRAAVGQPPAERAFAVNFPASTADMKDSESNLARTTREELHKLYPEGELQVVRDLSEAVHDGRPLLGGDGRGGLNLPQHGSNIARWLLLTVLVLLAAEVVMAWYFGHYSAVHERDRAPHGWSRGRYAGYLRVGLIVTMGLLLLFTLAAAVTLTHAAVTGDFLGFLPGWFRAGVEEAMGVPPPAPGEGTRWHLEFRPYLLSADADPWLIGPLAVALGALVYYVYRREGRVVTTEGARPQNRLGRLVTFCALRAGIFLLLLAILLPQLRLWFERQSWPDVVILVDDSGSMGEADDFRDPKVKAAAELLADIDGLKKEEKRTRLRLAQALIARADGDWITGLLTRRQAKVHVYHCSARAARIGSATKPEEAAALRQGVRELEARKENDSSQLGRPARHGPNHFRGAPPAAVIMLTDGVTTEGEDLAQVSKYAAQLKVPLFFVGIGDAQESRDVIVSDLEVAESVFVNDNLIF